MSNDPIETRKQNMANFYLTDVTFIVGSDEEKIPAFKVILALSNSVFKEMFSEKFKDEKEIRVPDVKPGEFKAFLNYVYFGDIDLSLLDCFAVYEIAHKYMVDPLTKLCVKEICARVSYENIYFALQWNQTYEIAAVQATMKMFFCENAVGCLKMAGFGELNGNVIAEILKWDEIRCSEELLYASLLIWIDKMLESQEKPITASNRKELLVDFLPLFKNLAVRDDCEIDNTSTASRYNWPLSTKNVTLSPSSAIEWNYTENAQKKTIVFGIKIPLTNFTKTALVEQFLVTVRDQNSSNIYKGEYKVKVQESLVLKDIYFTDPVIFEKGDIYLYVKFTSNRERLCLMNQTTSSNYPYSTQQVMKLDLLRVDFDSKLHSIFSKRS